METTKLSIGPAEFRIKEEDVEWLYDQVAALVSDGGGWLKFHDRSGNGVSVFVTPSVPIAVINSRHSGRAVVG
ncbi:MAG: hypothetical protein LBH13_06575 [Cellulomonadaceae bacterium]|jgi:hypothetical protein|nr:hypothetical protein [Cellulomonadaceae bacterium]